MSKFLTISLVIVALVIGTGLGFMITPQYAMTNDQEVKMADLGRADKYIDLRYINAMIEHHQSAMDLAFQVRDITKRNEIRELAQTIIKNEPVAIEELSRYKKDWYNDTSKVNAKETVNLGSYDDSLDLRFLNALIAHHRAGIEMTDDILTKSTRNETLTNASNVKEFLSQGIIALSKMRDTLYSQN